MRSLLALALLLPAAAFAGVEGYWKTIDDETGNPASIVHIAVEDGEARGRIVQLFRQPGEDPDPVCDECEGEKHDQRIVDMTILQGLEGSGSEWSGGEILDPGNGKTYSAYIEELKGGERLKVRGYLGVALLGRTQHWHRVDKPDLSVDTFLLNEKNEPMPLVYEDGRKASEEEIQAHLSGS